MNFKKNRMPSIGASDKRQNKSRNKVKKRLDPNLLIKKQSAFTEVSPELPLTSFKEMPLHEKLQRNLQVKGYVYPTAIQLQSYQMLAEGRDVIGIANTGTGKTGSFLIPMIDRLLKGEDPGSTLVMVPTRELALQVNAEFVSLTVGMQFKSACFIGGTSVEKDLNAARKNNHLIIGTPGRLFDLINRRAIAPAHISNLILDEFDRMLDMGFITDIKKILSLMTNRKQTMLFSATIDSSQDNFIKNMLKNPVTIKVSQGAGTADTVDQDIIKVAPGGDKFNMLLQLISNAEFEKVLLFTETKRGVDKVSKKLSNSGVNVEMIHGNKSQNYRIKALDKFKKGKIQVLVATDVAARGIDVSDITHVINYEIPTTFDTYIHRIGRTGRAGKSGKAYTFVD